MEINPRFSGGIGYAAAAELNLPYLALRGWVQGFESPEIPQTASPARALEVACYERYEDDALGHLAGAV
ncbi:ATP-grasp domain-containing protein [Caldichromatium japonicum]|uniref:ATP-grasp domain-containing protein n=1 Tax=Caldichromatium japonicum TaxID=2699430 RepID=UPI001FE40395|nr:ATP-grasp domain-containing protein [Caldichromatium japonicum]